MPGSNGNFLQPRPGGPAVSLVEVQARLDIQGRALRRSPLDPATIRESLRLMDRCLADLNGALDLDAEMALLVRQSVLQGAFPVLLLYQQGEPRAAWRLFLGLWRQIAEAFGGQVPLTWMAEVAEPVLPYLSFDPAWVRSRLAAFQAVVLESAAA